MWRSVIVLVTAVQVFGNANDPSLDRSGPSVSIEVPTSSSTYDAGTVSSVVVSGTSADSSGVSFCRVTNALTGTTSTAATTGGGAWSLSVGLAEGSNIITVTCLDPGNNAGQSSVTITRSASLPNGRQVWNGYTLPIGIPAGDSTHPFNRPYTAYAGQTYTAGGFAYRDDGFGAYSHFVNNAVSCSDSNGGGFGTAAAPRCTIPTTVPEGAVILVRNGTYTGAFTFTSQGTASKPSYVVGYNDGARPIVGDSEDNIVIAGDYLVFQYFQTDGRILGTANTSDFIALRDLIVGDTTLAGGVVNIRGNDWVVRDSEIRNITGGDKHGVVSIDGASNMWVLDNYIHDNQGDSFQTCHGCTTQCGPQNVYIGGNRMRGGQVDSENGVDFKFIRGNVVVSENFFDGDFEDTDHGNGEAIRINNDFCPGGNDATFYILYNDIRDASQCVNAEQSQTQHPIYVIGNRCRDVYGARGIGLPPNLGSLIVLNNSFYNMANVGIASGAEIRNNIIVNATNGAMANNADISANCSHNQVFGGNTQVDAQCTNTLTSDPGYTNPSSGDLSISSGSTAKDSGVVSATYAAIETALGFTVALDYAYTARPAGAAWDRGAFEVP